MQRPSIQRVKQATDMSGWQAARQGLNNALKTPSFLAMLAAPFVGYGAQQLDRHFDARRSAALKADSYRQMLDLHPHLRTRDPGEVNRIFNSLHNASPSMSRDPMVAGAWVDNIIESKGVGYNSHQGLLNAVKELTGIESNVSKTEIARRGDVRDRYERLTAGLGAAMDVAAMKGIHATFDEKQKHLDTEAKTFRDHKEKEEARMRDVAAARNKEFDDRVAARSKQLDDREREGIRSDEAFAHSSAFRPESPDAAERLTRALFRNPNTMPPRTARHDPVPRLGPGNIPLPTYHGGKNNDNQFTGGITPSSNPPVERGRFRSGGPWGRNKKASVNMAALRLKLASAPRTELAGMLRALGI